MPAELLPQDKFPLELHDPYLIPYTNVIHARYNAFLKKLGLLDNGDLKEFTKPGHRGFHVTESGIWYREWAPMARSVFLIGDFNDWNRTSHPMKKADDGFWEIFLPRTHSNELPISHGSRVKLTLEIPIMQNGNEPTGYRFVDRISPWSKCTVLDCDYSQFLCRIDPNRNTSDSASFSQPAKSPTIDSIFWNPSVEYKWKYDYPVIPNVAAGDSLLIYEAHVGIASEHYGIASYREFAVNVIPRIAAAGYNAVQLMAIMEHSYYASFGYQVTSFHSPSGRFGTPDDLKFLIDTAHGAGLIVLIDIVHSHASKNVLDGVNMFDGTDNSTFFHGGCRGTHSLWDSRLFDYGKLEVLKFLLCNLRMWAEEYHFDGFRFDGVTSMLYHHHGIAHGFTGHYDDYFANDSVDVDALVYLQLANKIAHDGTCKRTLLTIAEEVSGMPLLCRPTFGEGGVGFDMRLAMGIPDMWISLLKRDLKDEDWPIGHIVHTLLNRRANEPVVAYAESHDQALVGDKTLSHWLIDSELYTGMSTLNGPPSLRVDRGIALHKLIRCSTLFLGGEAYLNFMGNEFGHPEWLDFPRQGNGWSYNHARRQWSLASRSDLRYSHLGAFDKALLGSFKHVNLISRQNDHYRNMHSCESYSNANCCTQFATSNTCSSCPEYDFRETSSRSLTISRIEDSEQYGKLFVAQNCNFVLIVNWHPTYSMYGLTIGVASAGRYCVLLNSDNPEFGGHGRVDNNVKYTTEHKNWDGMSHAMTVYVPCRTALLYVKELPDLIH